MEQGGRKGSTGFAVYTEGCVEQGGRKVQDMWDGVDAMYTHVTGHTVSQ